MKKIILDIDGVLETTPHWKSCDILEDNFPSFNKTAAYNLNNIISQTNASIFLISSHKNRYTTDNWINIFKTRGINIDSISIINSKGNNRAEQIINYLNETNINDFIIIDDDTSLNDLPIDIKNRLVITKSLIGLDENDVNKALEILNYESKKI